jgi:hypothetical protein
LYYLWDCSPVAKYKRGDARIAVGRLYHGEVGKVLPGFWLRVSVKLLDDASDTQGVPRDFSDSVTVSFNGYWLISDNLVIRVPTHPPVPVA